MYSEPQTPSSVARPARRAVSSRARALRWSIAVVAFVVAAAYAIGGRDLVRQLTRRGRVIQSTAAEALQPPTEAEMQRAIQSAQSTAPVQTATPVSLRTVIVSIAGIMVVVTVLVFVTGRAARSSRA